MLEPDVSMLVEMARKLGRIERPREHLFWERAPQHPTQHVRRAVPPILALAMGVMMLAVVVRPPGLVGLLNLWPGARVGKRVVREPPLD